MDWSALPVVQGGALVVLLALLWRFYNQVSSGALVPRKVVDDMITVHADRLADKRDQITEWREAHRISEVAREKQDTALREALELAKVTEAAMRGFRSAAERLADQEGGA